jgi:rare lipoprotein A
LHGIKTGEGNAFSGTVSDTNDIRGNAMPLRIQTIYLRNIASFTASFAAAAILVGCGTVSLPPAPGAESPAQQATGPRKSLPALPRAGSGRGGYYQDDGPGDDIPDGLLDLPDAEPKVEPYTKFGNRPYMVFGKQYTPFTDERPFKQRGIGSWYGKKFHGQRTSSGEPYDMYKMTAAHPTMPLPSYARVTNLSNGKQVIVRVNDRGPFHSSRIIDLSYVAALKLDYLGKGSAQLEVERLLPEEIDRMAAGKREQNSGAQPAGTQQREMAQTASQPPAGAVKPVAFAADGDTPAAAPAPGFYIQLGAYSQAGNAEVARSRLMQTWSPTLPPLEVVQIGSVYRVHSGPFASRSDAATAALQLQNTGVSTTIVQR